jgi:hypothetical protein
LKFKILFRHYIFFFLLLSVNVLLNEGLRYIFRNKIPDWQADKVGERVIFRISNFWRTFGVRPPQLKMQDFKKTTIEMDIEAEPLSTSRDPIKPPPLFPGPGIDINSDDDFFA